MSLHIEDGLDNLDLSHLVDFDASMDPASSMDDDEADDLCFPGTPPSFEDDWLLDFEMASSVLLGEGHVEALDSDPIDFLLPGDFATPKVSTFLPACASRCSPVGKALKRKRLSLGTNSEGNVERTKVFKRPRAQRQDTADPRHGIQTYRSVQKPHLVVESSQTIYKSLAKLDLATSGIELGRAPSDGVKIQITVSLVDDGSSETRAPRTQTIDANISKSTASTSVVHKTCKADRKSKGIFSRISIWLKGSRLWIELKADKTMSAHSKEPPQYRMKLRVEVDDDAQHEMKLSDSVRFLSKFNGELIKKNGNNAILKKIKEAARTRVVSLRSDFLKPESGKEEDLGAVDFAKLAADIVSSRRRATAAPPPHLPRSGAAAVACHARTTLKTETNH